MGELSYSDDDDWGFGLVLPFWYRGSVLGFFFFLINTVLLLVCFAFALKIVICIDYLSILGIGFLCIL